MNDEEVGNIGYLQFQIHFDKYNRFVDEFQAILARVNKRAVLVADIRWDDWYSGNVILRRKSSIETLRVWHVMKFPVLYTCCNKNISIGMI